MAIQKWSETIWVAQPADEPEFTDDLSALRNDIANGAAAPDVVLDLSAVNYVGSSQLAQMLRLRKTVVDQGTRLRVVEANETVRAVFQTTGLDKVFDFMDDVTTALAQLQIDK